MQDRSTIQSYINDFRRHMAGYLKPTVGLSCTVYPAEQRGAILEFRLGPGVANEDQYTPVRKTVNDSLKKLKQQAFGGDLSGFTFAGTNIIAEGDHRLILIKGGDSSGEWNDKGAAADVTRIVSKVGEPRVS